MTLFAHKVCFSVLTNRASDFGSFDTCSRSTTQIYCLGCFLIASRVEQSDIWTAALFLWLQLQNTKEEGNLYVRFEQFLEIGRWTDPWDSIH